ncbi:hypothetical protein BGY98DRAFT_1019739 [Russula aff. rugulosa BPL654]|nr:hypothetical protein BGY98DRAFT_1019739 [Russula aff. rugulosa BPL654]
MVAQPVDCAKETIDSFSWSGLLGDSEKRQSLVEILSKRTPSNLTHSFYEPLRPLIDGSRRLLVIDRRVPRLIIKFMIDNKDEEFMHRRVKTIFRKVEGMQHSNAKSITDSQTFDVTKRLAASSVKPPAMDDSEMADFSDMGNDTARMVDVQ